MSDKKEIKWASIIPLIGGMSIANKLATNEYPQYLLSYAPFSNNEASLLKYWPNTKHLLIDENLEEVKSTIKERGKIDFVSSVCPCAGLSSLNSGGTADKNTKRGSDAIQNEWLYKAANFVLSEIKPKVYWGENAPALYTKTGQGVQNKLFEIAKQYGYSFSIIKTNTLLHGIPQHRQRTFYFFWQSKYAPILSWIEKPLPTLIYFLNQIPKDSLYYNKQFHKGQFAKLTDIPIYKYMIHKLGKDRKFLFIPPNMVDILSSPKFVGFLINREKTTLIIEDAERAIIDRNSNESSSISVSNLLNISDGIMSDFLDVNIIATFNSDKKNIDSALLRDGRLIAEYKFGKLNIDKTNYLLNKLDKNFISDKPMTVAEIYNINNELHRISATNKKIGFIHA